MSETPAAACTARPGESGKGDGVRPGRAAAPPYPFCGGPLSFDPGGSGGRDEPPFSATWFCPDCGVDVDDTGPLPTPPPSLTVRDPFGDVTRCEGAEAARVLALVRLWGYVQDAAGVWGPAE